MKCTAHSKKICLQVCYCKSLHTFPTSSLVSSKQSFKVALTIQEAAKHLLVCIAPLCAQTEKRGSTAVNKTAWFVFVLLFLPQELICLSLKFLFKHIYFHHICWVNYKKIDPKYLQYYTSGLAVEYITEVVGRLTLLYLVGKLEFMYVVKPLKERFRKEAEITDFYMEIQGQI